MKMRFIPRDSEQQFFLLTILVGFLAGSTAVLLQSASHWLMHLFGTDQAFGVKAAICGAISILIAGWGCTRYLPTTAGSGIPRTKIALAVHHGVITVHEWMTKLIVTIFTLASGVPLGIEGPTIAIAAGQGSSLARTLFKHERKIKELVYVGCSAGIAAAFNTPIAAVIFTMEEMIGNLHTKSLGPILIASLVASVTASTFKGQNALFEVAHYQWGHPIELVWYLALGLVTGLAGPIFVKNILLVKRVSKGFFKHHRLTPMLIAFALTGLASLFFPSVIGHGISVVNDVLQGRITDPMFLLVLILLKFGLAAFCYGTGMSGGILLPVIFIGAAFGGLLGSIVYHFSPIEGVQIGAYALVGMGAFFASVIKTPFTSVILVFEMTRDYRIVLPLMLANMVSYLLAEKQFHGSIYEFMSSSEGIDLPSHDEDELHHMSIECLYDSKNEKMEKPLPYADMIYPDQSIAVALVKLRHLKGKETLAVVNRLDPSEKLGTVSVQNIVDYLLHDGDKSEPEAAS